MALKDTITTMKNLLTCISKDIEKANRGNKAASQRVRTSTIKLEKVAKLFRKESVAAGKKGGKKAAKRAPAKKKAPAKRRATAKLVRRKKKR